jgi:hypothetical protein
MPIQNMAWHWGSAWNGATVTLQVNFAPQMAVAKASLSGANGDGLCMGGIRQYRTRTTPAGPDQDHNFQWNPQFGYPPVAYDPLMTSATADLVVGGSGQQGVMTLMVWLWT